MKRHDDLGAALRASLDAEAAHVDVLPAVEKALSSRRLPRVRRRPRRMWLGAAGATLAAVAAALIVFLRAPTPTNACDIESLEVDGVVASVFHTGDATVLFAEEE